MSSDILASVNNSSYKNGGTEANVAQTQQAQQAPNVPGVGKSDSGAGNQDNSSSKERNLQDAVNDVQHYVQNVHTHLSFSVEDDTGETVIKVVDSDTDETIRQIPSQEFLEIAKMLEKTKSVLMKTQV
jgi:flagellar protein FlaG